ncbi:hypothetical protein ACWGJP_10645 [Microbacterium sp. NPDC055903]
MSAVAAKSTTEESVKDWARRIAALAPPLADDQFQQLRAVMVVGTSGGRREASESRRQAA